MLSQWLKHCREDARRMFWESNYCEAQLQLGQTIVACRAKSTPDFISKMGIVEEETDECLFWFELPAESNFAAIETPKPLHKEANEILAMTVSSIKTPRSNLKNPQSQIRNPQSK